MPSESVIAISDAVDRVLDIFANLEDEEKNFYVLDASGEREQSTEAKRRKAVEDLLRVEKDADVEKKLNEVLRLFNFDKLECVSKGDLLIRLDRCCAVREEEAGPGSCSSVSMAISSKALENVLKIQVNEGKKPTEEARRRAAVETLLNVKQDGRKVEAAFNTVLKLFGFNDKYKLFGSENGRALLAGLDTCCELKKEEGPGPNSPTIIAELVELGDRVESVLKICKDEKFTISGGKESTKESRRQAVLALLNLGQSTNIEAKLDEVLSLFNFDNLGTENKLALFKRLLACRREEKIKSAIEKKRSELGPEILKALLLQNSKTDKKAVLTMFDEIVKGKEASTTYEKVNAFLKNLMDERLVVKEKSKPQQDKRVSVSTVQGERKDVGAQDKGGNITYFQVLLRTIGDMLSWIRGRTRYIADILGLNFQNKQDNAEQDRVTKAQAVQAKIEVTKAQAAQVDSENVCLFKKLLKIRQDIAALKTSKGDLKSGVETIIKDVMGLRKAGGADPQERLRYLKGEFNRALGANHQAGDILEKRSQEILADYLLHEPPAAQSGKFAVHSRRGMYTDEGVGSLLQKLCLEKQGFELVSFGGEKKYNFLRKATEEHGTIFVFNGAASAEESLPKPGVLQLDGLDVHHREKTINELSEKVDKLLRAPQGHVGSVSVKISIPILYSVHFTSLRLEIERGQNNKLIPKFYYVDPKYLGTGGKIIRGLALQLKRAITGDTSIQDVDISTVGPVVDGAVQARQYDSTSCGPFCVADTLAYVDSNGSEEACFTLQEGGDYQEAINNLRGSKYRRELVEFLGKQRIEEPAPTIIPASAPAAPGVPSAVGVGTRVLDTVSEPTVDVGASNRSASSN